MKFLVIGLGSMGKRRVRNLQALNEKEVAGFDLKEKRAKEAASKYSIDTFTDFDTAIDKFDPDVFVISTPPNFHMEYAYFAQNNGIHCFIEASVTDNQKILELSKKIENTDLIIVPSCTMRYFPAQVKLRELLDNNIIGKVLNFNYQSGQYLPDWHPWEKIEDFYVSNPETGGCREIVPFELTWINEVFGDGTPLACVKRKLTDMNADIDDLYHCILSYENGMLLNITVDVVARPRAVREFRIMGSEGEIVYSSDVNSLRYINLSMDDWEEISFEKGTVETQYINPEEPYINEVKDFINSIKNKDISLFPNSLKKDFDILETLNALEALSR